MEYKPKKDLSKKQVHIYLYKDIGRIIKAYGYNPTEFITMKALELFNDRNIETDIKELETEINKKEKEKEALETQLNNCVSDLDELNARLSAFKTTISNFNESTSNLSKAVQEVIHLGQERESSPEWKPFIYLDDITPICDKYDVNYMAVLSKIGKELLENNYKIYFKRPLYKR